MRQIAAFKASEPKQRISMSTREATIAAGRKTDAGPLKFHLPEEPPIRIYGKVKQKEDVIPVGYDPAYPDDPALANARPACAGWIDEPPDTDREMQDPKRRAEKGGELSISIQPGDERIGEIYFTVQYEGPNGAVETCLNGLNEALPFVRDWITQLLNETTNPTYETTNPGTGEKASRPTVIEMQLDSRPCPQVPARREG